MQEQVQAQQQIADLITLPYFKKKQDLEDIISNAWENVAPCWPLQHYITRNPLQGLEHLPFELALKKAQHLFQQKEITKTLIKVNNESIKWCQAYFDQGLAAISMPYKEKGLFGGWLANVKYQPGLRKKQRQWLLTLPSDSSKAIHYCLSHLKIANNQVNTLINDLLVSLPGWAGHVKYLVEWSNKSNISLIDFTAFRLALYCLHLTNTDKAISKEYTADYKLSLQTLLKNEQAYQAPLLHDLQTQAHNMIGKSDEKKLTAQCIFCIDTRSEPFRKQLEAFEDYTTYGFAGFFALPIQVTQSDSEHAYCPVMLEPEHHVYCKQKKSLAAKLKSIGSSLYKSLKYSFTTPFNFAEMMGLYSAWCLLYKTFLPNFHASTHHDYDFVEQALASIPLCEQIDYAQTMLQAIGLCDNFAELVVLFGHGSETKNNAYASALDCGACGADNGAINAQIMAAILNQSACRQALRQQGINIPDETRFIAALHNTTTDEITFFINDETRALVYDQYTNLKFDCQRATQLNQATKVMQLSSSQHKRSKDWAQVRPEWGLANNAAFIIGPRQLTQSIDLQGRAFLHSYDWKIDSKGDILGGILSAPVIVAQWINSQYLFSSLDNVAFGSGSKVTQNLTGQFGIMQGNSSDLMHGLPLQSVASDDQQLYHQMQRLLVVVYAPPQYVLDSVQQQPQIKNLITQQWIHLVCINPHDANRYDIKDML